MTATEQFQRGILAAKEVTGISACKASTNAGFNESQVLRFVKGHHDINLKTLEKLCVDGFGLSLEQVWELGK